MIELKEAVTKSLDALKGMSLVPEQSAIELEEAELEDGGNYWVVTFSYPDPKSGVEAHIMGPNLSSILRNKRAYKAVRLLAVDGTVRGIKSVHV
jgi:hypothetical protein